MRKNRKSGFTMAEVLIVVAIIAVLGGVAFVNVAKYMRSMKKIEFDGYAKEIFIAAQNHLTMSASEGYLDRKKRGNEDGDENGVYYFAVDQGNGLNDGDSLIGLMLPFGSVDGTILYGGSYIVRYHPDSAQVLDVFYWSKTDSNYKFTGNVIDYYSELKKEDIKTDRNKMMNFPPENGGAVIGWYGGAEAANLTKGEELKPISIKVINEDILKVEITDPNESNGILKLFIEGLTSGVTKQITVRKQASIKPSDSNDPSVLNCISPDGKTVTLDDITKSGSHFSELFSGDGLIPGENIRIWAKVYYDDKLGGPKESTKVVTNSLYADLIQSGESNYDTAQIAYFRHLENLGKNVSGVVYFPSGSGQPINISKAVQMKNLDWDKAFDGLGSKNVLPNGDSSGSKYLYYLPIVNEQSLNYDGKGLSISNVVIDATGHAGLIGSQTGTAATVHDLKLVDFNVRSTGGYSGALAGRFLGTIKNVLVINEDKTDSTKISGTNAGGLVGELLSVSTDNSVSIVSSVEGCAASVYVEGSSSAGGLIGSVGTSCTVTGCYSGGHTKNGVYSSISYDVTSGGTAGGLVGISSGKIKNCYSTCSASGGTAGGFVGTSSGTISYSYCTGLVSGTKVGAFAGTVSGEGQTVCQYYNIINSSVSNGKIEYMPPVSGTAPYGDITPFDKDTEIFQTFCKNADATARPYDKPLIKYYNGKYPLKRLSTLGDETDRYNTEDIFVNIHYGDWPMPMTFFTNKPLSAPTPTTDPDPTQTQDPTPTGTTTP